MTIVSEGRAGRRAPGIEMRNMTPRPRLLYAAASNVDPGDLKGPGRISSTGAFAE